MAAHVLVATTATSRVFLFAECGIGGDIEDFEDSGDCFGFSRVEAEEIAAKVGALGDDGVDHAGKTNVEAEPGCSLHLVGDVEVRDRAAEESEVFGVFQAGRCWGREGEAGARL